MAKMKQSTLVTGSIIFLAIILITSISHYRAPLRNGITSYITHQNPQPSADSTNLFSLPISTSQTWPHVIWQTSKYPSENQNDEDRSLAQTWANLNPLYRHEMMTHERMLGYIQDNFHASHPALEQLYTETKDYMLRTDVLRFLILLVEGGIYSDLDVTCLEPIDSWLDPKVSESAGIVIGVEFDNDLGPDGSTQGGLPLFQFASWTIMAKPNQPFLRYVVDDLIGRLANVTEEEQAKLSMQGVLELTGPAALTKAFLAYASEVTGTEVTRTNFSRITQPVTMGEVTVLPVWGFGAEHQVRNSGFEVGGEGRRALVKHHFKNSWKQDHT